MSKHGPLTISNNPLSKYEFRAVGNTLYSSLGDGEPPEYLVFFSQSDDVKRIAERHNEIIRQVRDESASREKKLT